MQGVIDYSDAVSILYYFTSGAGYVTPSDSNLLYYYGSTVTVQAVTYPGYVFDGWYLNGVYQGKLSTITLTITQDYSLYAVFSQRTTILTIAANPPLKAEQQPPELASGIIVPAQQQQLRHTQLLATTLAGGS